MSFETQNLSVLAYANNFTLWHYATADDSITDNDYFNKAAGMLRKNDWIIANVDTDGASPVTKFYIVTVNDGADVEVAEYA